MNLSKIRMEVGDTGRKFFFFSMFFVLFIVLMSIPRIAIPFGIASVLYIVFEPIIPMLMKAGVTRKMAIGIVFLGLMFVVIYPIVKLAPTIKNETENFQSYMPTIEYHIKKNYLYFRNEIKKRIGVEVGDKVLFDSLTYGREITKAGLLKIPKILTSVLEWFFLVPLFLYFLLKDTWHIKRMVLRLAPNSIFERYYCMSHKFYKHIGNYIFAKFIEASIVGTVITSGLLIMNVRFALLLGLLAGITNIIPYLGPLLGVIPAIIWVLVEYGFSTTFGGVIVLYLVANVIDLAIVFPILVSKVVNLHPIIVVVSVILGSQYFGIVGMILSIPAAVAIKLIFMEVYNEVYAGHTK